jgi:hypothetical protein
VTYGVLLRRKAIVGLSWTVATAVVAVVFLLAPAVISALAHPDYVAGRSYSQLLKSYDSCGLSGVIDFDGFRGVVFVAAQLFGVLLYIVAWTAGTTLLLVLMAVNLARLKARPLRLWTRLLALPGPWRKHPLRVVSAAFACALASLAVSGGTAQRQVFAHSPQLSQVRASVEDGRVQLMVRSDFPAHVTIRLGRSGSTRRTVRRDAVQGVNRFGFKQADGSHWPEKTYRLRLTARDAKGKTAEPISMLVPGRYPDRAAWTCEKPAGAA